MKSRGGCSQCRRALRAAAGLQPSLELQFSSRFLAAPNRSTPPAYQLRGQRRLFSQTSQRQQLVPKQHDSASERPPPPLSSPPAKPSNASEESSPDYPSASTAQMQRQIASNLGRSPSLSSKIAQSLQKALPNTTSTYITYGLAESLFNSCSNPTAYTISESQRTKILAGTGPPKTASGEDIGQPDPPLAASTSASSNSTSDTLRHFFFHDLSLLPTFSTWSQTTFLHMYLLTVRLRSLDTSSTTTTTTTTNKAGVVVQANPGSFQNYQQYLLEHFSQSAELKMNILHTITARGIRNRYLKDLFLQWRGIIAAYDQGLVEGDAMLASAVWRNLFKGAEDVDWQKVALVVAYMRRAIVELEKVQDVRQLARGALDGPNGVWVRSLEGLQSLVESESKGVKEPLS